MRVSNLLTTLLLLAAPYSMQAQNNDPQQQTENLPTIDDIIRQQQRFTETNQRKTNLDDIWRRRTYFNINYGLSPKVTLEDGTAQEETPELLLAIKNGRNFFLHRKAIGKMAYIGLDYTWLDINFNRGKADNFEIDYSMAIGPSLHFAPFARLNGRKAIQHLRLSAYYHIGYNVGLHYQKTEPTQKGENTTMLDLATGTTKGLGFAINWKAIGFGFETHNTPLKYKPIGQSDDENNPAPSQKYKLTTTYNRIYLQFRF